MKGSNVRDALKAWEEETHQVATEAEEVKLFGRIPPIEKMDASVGSLANCRVLSLSTNTISQIANLSGLNKLEILSLGRNSIKNLGGLDAVSDTLQQLWISYNNIEKLSGIEKLKKLKILYMSNNRVSSWNEFERLRELPDLEDLVMAGNPLEQSSGEHWRVEVIRRLPNLKKLDGHPISSEDREQALGQGPS